MDRKNLDSKKDTSLNLYTNERIPVFDRSQPYRMLINTLEEKNTDLSIIKQAIATAMQSFPTLPDFAAEYAKILASEYDFVKAVQYMQRAFTLKEKYAEKEPSLFTKEFCVIAAKNISQWQKIIKLTRTIRLSACVIIKNEEKNILHYFNRIRNCTDEQIIVDTGSTDNTLSLLQELPANIYHYKWQNDFAAAKNFAISKARGDWIIFLDADEYFSLPSAEKLRAIIAAETAAAVIPDTIMCTEINIEEKTGKEINRFVNPRIFRNLPHLRYQGKIHEQIYNSKLPLTLKTNDSLCIYHTGYSTALTKEKAQRNLQLLLSQKYDENNPVHWHYFADCYYGMGDFQKAVFCIEQYFRQDKYQVVNAECGIWRNYINALLILKKPFSQIKTVIKNAIAKFPQIADFYTFAGYIAYQQKEYIQAEKYFLKAKKIYRQNNQMNITGTAFTADKENIDVFLTKIKHLKNKLTISACVIVKNNEKDIKKWLDCVKHFSDEIIVIDTGSEDRTIDITQKAGATIYSFPWQDDFAKAKNYAITKATGKWIVFLDADEYFAEGTDIKQLLTSFEDKVEAVSCNMVNIDVDNNNTEINRFPQIRIFLNNAHIRYKGKIHEQLHKSTGELQITTKPDLIIYHTGYSQSICTEKLKRNLMIMLDDIQKNSDNIYYYRYLADCYTAFADYDKAIFYYKKHLQTGLHSLGNESEVYFNLIDSMIKGKKPYIQILPFIKKACIQFPQHPEFPAQFGALNFLLKKYSDAKKYLQLSLAMKNNVQNLSTDNFTALVPEVYRYLAAIFFLENNTKESFIYLDRSLQTNKYNYKALRLLIKLLKAAKEKETFASIMKYYDCNIKDLSFIGDQLFATGNIALFTYCNQILHKKFNIYSENWKAWDILMKENKENAFNELLAHAIEKIQLLFISLLSANDLSIKYQSILPDPIWNCLCAYYGKTKLQADNDFDAYLTLLPVVISRTPNSISQKYIAMAMTFPKGILIKVIEILYRFEKWTELYTFLLEIMKEQRQSNNNFLFIFAKCAYYNKDFTNAENFFQDLLNKNYRPKEVKAYLLWIKERRTGKW